MAAVSVSVPTPGRGVVRLCGLPLSFLPATAGSDALSGWVPGEERGAVVSHTVGAHAARLNSRGAGTRCGTSLRAHSAPGRPISRDVHRVRGKTAPWPQLLVSGPDRRRSSGASADCLLSRPDAPRALIPGRARVSALPAYCRPQPWLKGFEVSPSRSCRFCLGRLLRIPCPRFPTASVARISSLISSPALTPAESRRAWLFPVFRAHPDWMEPPGLERWIFCLPFPLPEAPWRPFARPRHLTGPGSIRPQASWSLNTFIYF